MQSDNFFEKIDEEVFVANAERINVYVRYADTTQGSTTPSGSDTFKVEVGKEISCVTNTSYGFHHWAAFSTEKFNINGQNTEILFSSDNDEYENGYGAFELDEDVVTFGDKYSETTNVIIHKNRNDIVLVPVVALRPSVDRRSPATGAKDIVRNTSIRCIFTKKMHLSSFTKDTVKITSGFAVLTDLETDTEDITDWYIWGDPEKDESYSPMLSTSGKLVTFRLKPGENLGSNQQITVAFSPELKDADGYEEGVKNEFYFITGTSIDSLAPILHQVKGGIKGKFKDFDSSGKANRDNIKTKPFGDSFFDSYLPHRVKDYVNIYVWAGDIGGEGTGVSVADADENAVIYYGTRAKLLYDSNGAAVDSSAAENIIEAQQQAYIPNGNHVENSTDTTGGYGCAFTYDLSSLPDGIVEIDVWTVDSVGNSGLDERYYETYDNGYRALIVVKDTTPPVVDTSIISAHSTSATYGWYNAATLGETNLNTSAAIPDAGNIKLRAADNTVKWNFAVGDNADSWTPAINDTSWKLVTAGDYALSGITAQKEGAVGILMSLMDDMGNIAAPQPLGNAVMFDKTKPVISALSWVDASGKPIMPVTSDVTDNSLNCYLRISFTEELSGVREIAINLNNASGSSAIAAGTTKFYTSIGGDEINYNAKAGSNFVELVPPAGKDGYYSGDIYVKGIKLGSSDEGLHTLSVAVTDAALNESDSVAKSISRDSTPPVLKKIVIPLIKRIKQFGEDLWRYFVGKDASLSNSIPVELYIEEVSSGIKIIDFSGGNITPTDSSTITMTAGGVTKPVTDFTLDGGVITFGENSLGAISDENEFKLSISNCRLANIKTLVSSAGENTISVLLTDFADLESDSGTPKTSAKFSDDSEYTKIIANTLASPTPTIILADRGTDASGTADLIPAQTGFTNYKVVDGKVNVIVSDSTNDFVELKLTDGATFTDSSAIVAKEVGGSAIELSEGGNNLYEISADKKSIVFTKAFTESHYTSGIEFNITNIELSNSSTDGEKTVVAQTVASAEIPSDNGSCKITLDTAAPQTSGVVSYSGEEKDYPRKESDVLPAKGVTFTTDGIPYFYTSDTNRQFDIITRESASPVKYYKVDDNEYSIKISATETTAIGIYNDSSALTEFKATSPKVTIEMNAQLQLWDCNLIRTFFTMLRETTQK